MAVHGTIQVNDLYCKGCALCIPACHGWSCIHEKATRICSGLFLVTRVIRGAPSIIDAEGLTCPRKRIIPSRNILAQSNGKSNNRLDGTALLSVRNRMERLCFFGDSGLDKRS
jgi:hypothetical protein